MKTIKIQIDDDLYKDICFLQAECCGEATLSMIVKSALLDWRERVLTDLERRLDKEEVST